MAMMMKTEEVTAYCIVHPLNDKPEVKRDPNALGPMEMTTSVKFALFALRAYLIVMGVLVGYHVLDLAGVFGKGHH